MATAMEENWMARLVSLFPVTLYGWLKFGLLMAIIVQGVRLLFTLLTPIAPYGGWEPNAATILGREERAALFSGFDPFNRNSAAAQDTSTAVTSLDLTLFGIRMNQGSGLGSAIIAGEDGVQFSYAIGEEITGGVSLESVAFDHVVINRSGTRESLFLDQSIPATTVGTEPAPLSDAALSGAQQASAATRLTPDAIRENINFSPRSQDGRITGFAVSPGPNAEMFRAAGFRNGDVIVSINSQPITAAGDITSLTNQLAPGARLSVSVERGANTVPLAIVIPSQ